METIKYPKTPRLAEIQDQTPQWRKHAVVVEEKVDGANLGIRWSDDEGPVFQSRGHILQGGANELQFAPVYNWGAVRSDSLREALGSRLMVYGEWCFAKHRAFYDALPDLFLGFDVLDLKTDVFLPHRRRDEILAHAGITIVPHLFTGVFGKAPAFASFIGRSRLKSRKWRDALAKEAARVNARNVMAQTDDSDDMEGVYVRIEDDAQVVARVKVHREGFEKICSDGWGQGPHIRNGVLAV